MVDRESPPDIIFDEADPAIGGLRTWPQLRLIIPNKLDIIHKITNIKTCIIKTIKATTHAITTKCVFGAFLQAARDTGTDFSIQAYSRAHSDAGETHMR